MRIKELTEVEKFYIQGHAGLSVEQLVKDLGRKATPQNIKLVKDLVDLLPQQSPKQPEPGIPGHFLKQSGAVSMTMAQSVKDDKDAEAQRAEQVQTGGRNGGVHKIRPNEPTY